MSDLVRYRDRAGQDAVARVTRLGEGEAVLLLHGVGMQMSVWEPQIRSLSEGFDVIAIDLLGHGGSSLPPEEARLSDYADEAIAVLDALGVESAHVVGHSMGALVALELSLSHPQRVRSVITLNAVFRRDEEQRRSVESRLASLAENGPGDSRQTIARWFGEPAPEKWRRPADIVSGFLKEADPVGYGRAYKLFATADELHAPRLGTLEPPALFMTGEHDPNSTPAMSKTMAALAPHGRFDVIAGERHMMSLTAPDEVSRRIAAFLTSCRHGLGKTPGDPKSFRKALGGFLTGVTVVATIDEQGEPRGFTANSFSSVSLDPPLVSVCIGKQASSYATFREAERFSINVLSEDQTHLSVRFATRNAERFVDAAWSKGPAGSPVFDGVAAWFDCALHQAIEAGDHTILIGRVVGFDDRPTNPLGYWRGAHAVFGLPLGRSGKNEALKVEAILEHDGAVLFLREADRLTLPAGRSLGSVDDPTSLVGRLKSAGVRAELGFLFAVYDEAKSGKTAIVHRGELLEAPTGTEAVLVPIDDVPWTDLADDPTRAMLKRYVHEKQQGAFGVYAGDAESGVVHALAQSA